MRWCALPAAHELVCMLSCTHVCIPTGIHTLLHVTPAGQGGIEMLQGPLECATPPVLHTAVTRWGFSACLYPHMHCTCTLPSPTNACLHVCLEHRHMADLSLSVLPCCCIDMPHMSLYACCPVPMPASLPAFTLCCMSCCCNRRSRKSLRYFRGVWECATPHVFTQQ